MRSYRTFLFLVLALMLAAFASAQQILVLVNEKAVSFPDVQPKEMAGRVMVPIRGVFERLGATVKFDESDQRVIIQQGEDEITLKVGDDFANKNGQVVYAKSKAVMIHGRVMVPLRFLSETLGARVEWIGAERTVRISTSVTLVPPR